MFVKLENWKLDFVNAHIDQLQYLFKTTRNINYMTKNKGNINDPDVPVFRYETELSS